MGFDSGRVDFVEAWVERENAAIDEEGSGQGAREGNGGIDG